MLHIDLLRNILVSPSTQTVFVFVFVFEFELEFLACCLLILDMTARQPDHDSNNKGLVGCLWALIPTCITGRVLGLLMAYAG